MANHVSRFFQILPCLWGFSFSSPEAAVVSHHGSVPYHHTTPYPPPYGHSTPVYPYHKQNPSSPGYGHSPVAYAHSSPVYGYSTPSPYDHHRPHHHTPTPHHPPHHSPYKSCGYEKAPLCSYNTTKPWCLKDHDYPEYEVKAAAEYHKVALLSAYADVTDLSTHNSVVRPDTIDEETYLCPSQVAYVRPLRAINTDGKWRVIVNNIKVDYEALTQTTRLEECLEEESPCALVPHCHDSKCLQKSVYHRFLVYDPCDTNFPFAVETFQLPASCACHLDDYYIAH